MFDHWRCELFIKEDFPKLVKQASPNMTSWNTFSRQKVLAHQTLSNPKKSEIGKLFVGNLPSGNLCVWKPRSPRSPTIAVYLHNCSICRLTVGLTKGLIAISIFLSFICKKNIAQPTLISPNFIITLPSLFSRCCVIEYFDATVIKPNPCLILLKFVSIIVSLPQVFFYWNSDLANNWNVPLLNHGGWSDALFISCLHHKSTYLYLSPLV